MKVLIIVLQVYFINHRYDGVQLWQLQNVSGIHQLVWISSFISFIFLYPSTFNLLEVAAVDKPKMHLWETGIMRITRHPQVLSLVFLYSCILLLCLIVREYSFHSYTKEYCKKHVEMIHETSKRGKQVKIYLLFPEHATNLQGSCGCSLS